MNKCVDPISAIKDLAEFIGHPIQCPGTWTHFVDHPLLANVSIEIGVVQEHRYAFSYWSKWFAERRQRGAAGGRTALLTIDWHDDFGVEGDFDPARLERIDLGDANEVSLFSYAMLHCLNDGHILPAMHLGIFDSVVMLNKQGVDGSFGREVCVAHGRHHDVECYRDLGQAMGSESLLCADAIYLDVDLDYFVEDADEEPVLVLKEIAASMLSVDSDLMRMVLPRIDGMTIALEPDYCGGLQGSMDLLSVLNDALFDGTMGQSHMRWAER